MTWDRGETEGNYVPDEREDIRKYFGSLPKPQEE